MLFLSRDLRKRFLQTTPRQQESLPAPDVKRKAFALKLSERRNNLTQAKISGEAIKSDSAFSLGMTPDKSEK